MLCLADLLGNIMGAYGAVTAPFSIAVNLRGYEQLIMDIVENREFVHRLMEFCTRLAAGFGQIQLKNGAMATSIIDAWASPPLVSMEIFDEFILPYTARVIGMLSPARCFLGRDMGLFIFARLARSRAAGYFSRIGKRPGFRRGFPKKTRN